jgi:four helix bundle protein
MKDFKKLTVWQKSHSLAIDVYNIVRAFPAAELYGLTSQVRRAASSIPANLAEGCGRGGDSEFNRFIQIAMGSASELEYHLLLAKDLKYINENDYARLNIQVDEVKRMLTALIKRLKADR